MDLHPHAKKSILPLSENLITIKLRVREKTLRKFARMQKIIPLKFQGEKLLYKKKRTKLTISLIITETSRSSIKHDFFKQTV